MPTRRTRRTPTDSWTGAPADRWRASSSRPGAAPLVERPQLARRVARRQAGSELVEWHALLLLPGAQPRRDGARLLVAVADDHHHRHALLLRVAQLGLHPLRAVVDLGAQPRGGEHVAHLAGVFDMA